MTDAAKQVEIREFIRDTVVSAITKPSARDLQRLPGPSNLANQCNVCVARDIGMALGIQGYEEPENFSLKAWNGTAVHAKLEGDVPLIYPDAEQEITVEVGRVPKLGTIVGHVDLYVPEYATVVDYKTTDLAKLAKYRVEGVPKSHAGQTMLYLRGVRNSGRPAETGTLVYIPRDSNKVSDIWVASCSYRPDIAEALLNRARTLTEMVLSGRAQALQPHPDCYLCSGVYKFAR